MKVDLSLHVHEEAYFLCVLVTNPYGGICLHSMAGPIPFSALGIQEWMRWAELCPSSTQKLAVWSKSRKGKVKSEDWRSSVLGIQGDFGDQMEVRQRPWGRKVAGIAQ